MPVTDARVGEVKARCEQRRVHSDWTAVERERGISASSAVSH
jgi:peptide subunit release factor RF-3